MTKHDHVRFETANATIIFNDPRRFGFMVFDGDRNAPDVRMGPEPLGNSFDAPTLHETLRSRRTPIKTALLDQQVVAGLGNIYVCEALFRTRISPRRLACNVSRARCETLVPAIRNILEAAIAAGGSSLRDHAQTDGRPGWFQHAFEVYGRENAACVRCATPVRRIVQSGRSTFFCSTCQR